MYNKTLLAVVVATGIAMFIITSSFHDMYGGKSATTAINWVSVGRSCSLPCMSSGHCIQVFTNSIRFLLYTLQTCTFD